MILRRITEGHPRRRFVQAIENIRDHGAANERMKLRVRPGTKIVAG